MQTREIQSLLVTNKRHQRSRGDSHRRLLQYTVYSAVCRCTVSPWRHDWNRRIDSHSGSQSWPGLGQYF